MQKPSFILWDWDGTLLNTLPTSAQALRQLGRETNVDITDADVFEVVGGHLVDFWYRHYGPDPMVQVKRFISLYREFSKNVAPFPETKPILSFVQSLHIPQIVVSNKNQDIIQAEADRLGLTSYFTKIVGTVNQGFGKPEKAYADHVFGPTWPAAAIMIGDGKSDMEFAKLLHAFGILIYPDPRHPPYACNQCLPTLAAVGDYLRQQPWEQEEDI